MGVSRSARAGAAALLLLSCSSPDRIGPQETYRLSVRIGQATEIFAAVGSSLQLEARVLSSSGDTTSFVNAIALVSRNTDVATVDSTGLASVAGTGATYIVASAPGFDHVLPDSIKVTGTCTLELRWMFTPAQPSIAVGETFTPSITVTSCGGYVTLIDDFSWSVNDPTIVSVNAATGATVGLKPGTTYLIVQGRKYPVMATLNVTVF
jgi:hypothetical protein